MLKMLVVCSLLSLGADSPYQSVGFVKFPAEVELGAVSAVAAADDGRVYVLHRGQPPLLRFNAQGEYEKGWGKGKFKVPHGLRLDSQGNIWTTDNGNHVLRKFSPDGELLTTLGTEGKAAGGKDGFRSPDDLVFDSKGRMYVADAGNARIVQLSATGEFLKQWGSKGKKSGEFATAHGIAIDRNDRIYVADRGNKRVQVFSTDGEHLGDWTGAGNSFGLLAVGDELLSSEGDAHKIFHFDLQGKIIAEWGNKEELQLPHLMAVNRQGKLYVAEVNGKRVQMFERRSAGGQ